MLVAYVHDGADGKNYRGIINVISIGSVRMQRNCVTRPLDIPSFARWQHLNTNRTSRAYSTCVIASC